jgi:SAM-dependent methyltransferase
MPPDAVDDPATKALRDGYDAVAERYAARFFDELDHKPLDRALLDHLAGVLPAPAGPPVADLGCGPGHAARYLHDRHGLGVVGVDLSPAMVAQAARRSPGLEFVVGDLRALPAADGAWAGIVALYSIIHLEPGDLPRAFAEFHRVLRPGGPALVAFHAGHHTVHADDFLGQRVSIDFHFLDPPAVAAGLQAAGLVVEATVERRPYEPFEVATTRAYLLARKPA